MTAGSVAAERPTRGHGVVVPMSDTPWPYRFALVAVVTPIVTAAARAIANGWYPVSDDALFPLRALDVFSAHPPLLGTWSSGAGYAGINFNHPGPLMFYLLAIPVRIFGPAAGTVVGTAAVNAAATLAVVWLAKRRAGGAFALATAGAVLGLEWAMGSNLLFDPWNPHAATLPACALLFAAWSLVDGDWAATPILVFSASLALQLHLSYALLAPAVVGVALLGAFVVHRWAGHRSRPGRDQRSPVRWSTSAVIVGVLVWIPPMWQQLTGHPGNLTAMFHARQHSTERVIGLLRGARTVSAVVALPPWWFPPGWDRPRFDTLRLGEVRMFPVGAAVALAALAAVVLLLAGLGASAIRHKRRTVALGSALALLWLVVGWVSAAQASSPFDSIESYVRWLWPIALFCWLQIGLAAARTEPVRRLIAALKPRLGVLVANLGVVAGVALCLVGLVGAFGGPDRGSGSPPWGRAAGRSLANAAGPALAGSGPVLVHEHFDLYAGSAEPPVLVSLIRHDVRFYVDQLAMSHQVGSDRLYRGQPTRTTVWLASGDNALVTPHGARRIALHRGLSTAQEREYRRLRAYLSAQIGEHGLRVTRGAAALLDTRPMHGTRQALANARTAPMAVLGNQVVQSLLLNGVVSPADPNYTALRRYASLDQRWASGTVALFAAPTGSPDAPAPNPPGTGGTA